MKKKSLREWLIIVGVIIVGAVAGYLYWHYVGCVSGSCPIKSNPYSMTLFGALLGYLIYGMFSDIKTWGKNRNSSDKSEDSTHPNQK